MKKNYICVSLLKSVLFSLCLLISYVLFEKIYEVFFIPYIIGICVIDNFLVSDDKNKNLLSNVFHLVFNVPCFFIIVFISDFILNLGYSSKEVLVIAFPFLIVFISPVLFFINYFIDNIFYKRNKY